jgi:hypothetical protein
LNSILRADANEGRRILVFGGDFSIDVVSLVEGEAILERDTGALPHGERDRLLVGQPLQVMPAEWIGGEQAL